VVAIAIINPTLRGDSSSTTKGPGTGNENVGDKGGMGPSREKKGAGRVSGEVGTGNKQP